MKHSKEEDSGKDDDRGQVLSFAQPKDAKATDTSSSSKSPTSPKDVGTGINSKAEDDDKVVDSTNKGCDIIGEKETANGEVGIAVGTYHRGVGSYLKHQPIMNVSHHVAFSSSIRRIGPSRSNDARTD